MCISYFCFFSPLLLSASGKMRFVQETAIITVQKVSRDNIGKRNVLRKSQQLDAESLKPMKSVKVVYYMP